MSTIVLATSNRGKLAEIQSSLSFLPITWVSQAQFSVSDAEETGMTFVENAILKARHASQHTGLPALSDDSGLMVPALNQEPGIYSARYAGEHATGKQHIEKLLLALDRKPNADRQATLWCVMVLMRHATDPVPYIFQGCWRGEILSAPRGEHGFGYDPIFWVPSHQCSAAELSPQEKNQLSHRAQAMKLLIACLEKGAI